MTNIWKNRAVLKIENYIVEFQALEENAYDRDPMCDCVGKLITDAGKYRVYVRSNFESTAASPVLAVDTTREFGNRIFLNMRNMTSDTQVEKYIDYIAYNILKNGNEFFKIYQDKYSGYLDGETLTSISAEEMHNTVHDYPVRHMKW